MMCEKRKGERKRREIQERGKERREEIMRERERQREKEIQRERVCDWGGDRMGGILVEGMIVLHMMARARQTDRQTDRQKQTDREIKARKA